MTELRSVKTAWADGHLRGLEVDKRTVPAVIAEVSGAMDRAIQKLLASLAVSTTAGLEPGTDLP